MARDGAKLGLVIERSDIVSALAVLIKDGLAKAYLLSPFHPPEELQSMPLLEVIEENFETYFYITKKGIEVHLSDDSWWPSTDDIYKRRNLNET